MTIKELKTLLEHAESVDEGIEVRCELTVKHQTFTIESGKLNFYSNGEPGCLYLRVK